MYLSPDLSFIYFLGNDAIGGEGNVLFVFLADGAIAEEGGSGNDGNGSANSKSGRKVSGFGLRRSSESVGYSICIILVF